MSLTGKNSATEHVARLLCGSDYGPLVRMGEPALAPLLEELAHASEADRRAFAASALGKLGQPGALNGLLAALGDPVEWVRTSATLALGELADERALSVLHERALAGDSHAATALARLGPAGAPALVEVLQSWPVPARWQVARYLGESGYRAAAPALEAQLRLEHDGLRTEAALALGRLGDAGAVAALLGIVADGWHGAQAVHLLVGVLAEQAGNVADAVLQAAAALEDPHDWETEQAVGFGNDPIVGMRRIDGAAVRRLARTELERRAA